VRVRLTRIEPYDLNLFEFDYDLTLMIFFLDPSGKHIYARYGQRNGASADALQSLAGLEYTMRSVLAMHAGAAPEFAPRTSPEPRFIRDVQSGRGRRGFHCHNVREAFDRELKAAGRWTSASALHFPLPEAVGLTLEVDRGNVIARVQPGSPAARAGLEKGDRVTSAGAVPVHSIADFQFALEHLPARADLRLRWSRGGAAHAAVVALAGDWRRGDVSWRPSLYAFVPTLYLRGTGLSAVERTRHGLTDRQLAFRLPASLGDKARIAGFSGGDVVLGVEGQALDDMDDAGFSHWLQSRYLIGDTVRFAILREGQRLVLPVVLP
jgi:hypothetical protein